jgi:hypothetical protein
MVILETDVKKSMNFPIADFSHLQQKVRLGTQRASVKPIGVHGVDKKRVNSRPQEQKAASASNRIGLRVLPETNKCRRDLV